MQSARGHHHGDGSLNSGERPRRENTQEGPSCGSIYICIQDVFIQNLKRDNISYSIERIAVPCTSNKEVITAWWKSFWCAPCTLLSIQMPYHQYFDRIGLLVNSTLNYVKYRPWTMSNIKAMCHWNRNAKYKCSNTNTAEHINQAKVNLD